MTKKITPEGLRIAAEEMEKAAQKAVSAAAAKKAADAASKEASDAARKAEKSFRENGLGGDTPPPSSGGDSPKNNKGCSWCSLLAIGLALITGTVLWFTKADNSEVAGVKNGLASVEKKADQALIALAKKCEVACPTSEVQKPNMEDKVVVAPVTPKKPTSKPKAEKPKKPVIPATASAPVIPAVVPPVVTGHVSRSDAVWYWRENTATQQNPGRCIFSSGNGEGRPPFCATFSIISPKQGESESVWIGRVGGGGRVEIDQVTYQQK